MSKETNVTNKEPFVRMTKRDSISAVKAWGIRLIAVLLSLVVSALVIVAITKQNRFRYIWQSAMARLGRAAVCG